MLPDFLIPETVITSNGEGNAVAIPAQSGLIQITLGVLDVVEQESLLVSLESSKDASAWALLAQFPQRFYTGASALVIRPGLNQFVRARWTVSRWGRGSHTPSFRVYLFADLLGGLEIATKS